MFWPQQYGFYGYQHNCCSLVSLQGLLSTSLLLPELFRDSTSIRACTSTFLLGQKRPSGLICPFFLPVSNKHIILWILIIALALFPELRHYRWPVAISANLFQTAQSWGAPEFSHINLVAFWFITKSNLGILSLLIKPQQSFVDVATNHP